MEQIDLPKKQVTFDKAQSPSVLSKVNEIFKSLGPGFIIASVVLGPGSITVASSIGSEQGYSFYG